MNPEQRANLSALKTGVKLSPEHRAAISEGRLRYHRHAAEARARRRKIYFKHRINEVTK